MLCTAKCIAVLEFNFLILKRCKEEFSLCTSSYLFFLKRQFLDYIAECIYNMLEIKVKVSNSALLIQDHWSLQMYTKILTSRV